MAQTPKIWGMTRSVIKSIIHNGGITIRVGKLKVVTTIRSLILQKEAPVSSKELSQVPDGSSELR